MKAELLTRVTSHAQSLDGLTYTGKKTKKITAQGKETVNQVKTLDLATIQGALGLCRLSPFISNLLYAKYQNYQSPELESQVSEYLFRRWSGPPLDVAGATQLIIWELLHHHVCRRCGGSGKRMVTESGRQRIGKILECEPCKGTGTRKPNEKSRAQHLNIPYTSWQRKYAAPFSKLQSRINELISQAEGSFACKMA